MRSVRVTGPLVTVEMLARACAEAEARVPDGEWSEPIFLIVNEVDLGLVPLAVWEQVRERLVSILDDHVSFEEAVEQRPAARSPAAQSPAAPTPAAPTPVARSSVAGSPAARSSTPTPPEPVRRSGRRTRRVRVLVAEHDGSFRAELLAAFAGAGYDVLGVADGVQALRQLGTRPPHVLVADFELPKLAGDELLARARALPSSVVRLGVLVGAALPQILVPEHEAADLVLGQPLTAAGVVEQVREVLAARDKRSADR